MRNSQIRKRTIIGLTEIIYSTIVILIALSGLFYNTEFLHYLSRTLLVLGICFLLAGIMLLMNKISVSIGFTIFGFIVNINFWMFRYETIAAFTFSIIPLLCVLSTIYIWLYDAQTP